MNGNCEACEVNDLEHSIRIRTSYCYVTTVVSKHLPSDTDFQEYEQFTKVNP